MEKHFDLKALVLAVSLLTVSGLAQAEFKADMTKEQVAAEMKAQKESGMPMDIIAKRAIKAGVAPDLVVLALIQLGESAPQAANVVIAIKPDAKNAIIAVLIAQGVDPTTLPSMSATASQGETSAPINPANIIPSNTVAPTPPASGGSGTNQASPA